MKSYLAYSFAVLGIASLCIFASAGCKKTEEAPPPSAPAVPNPNASSIPKAQVEKVQQEDDAAAKRKL